MKVLKNERGQSLVEFAIILPIILLTLMGTIEFGLMLNAYLAISNAAREGARAGIVGSTSSEIVNLIETTSPSLNPSDMVISVTPDDSARVSGNMLTVRITYNYHPTLPIISSIIGNNITLNAQTVMRIE